MKTLPIAHLTSSLFMTLLESSLERLEIIQLQLREEEAALQKELSVLMDELQRDQDPERMQIIQELISVSFSWPYFTCIGWYCVTSKYPSPDHPYATWLLDTIGTAIANQSYSREGLRVRSCR